MREICLLEDIYFKETFGRSSRIKFIEYFMECFLNQKLGSLNGKIKVILDSTLEKTRKDDKGFISDVLLVCHDIIYNIEAYTKFDSISLTKSLSYLGRIYSTQLDAGIFYKKVRKVCQILLVDDVRVSLEDHFKTINQLQSKRRLFTDQIEVCVIRVDKGRKLFYNEGVSDNSFIRLIEFIGAKENEVRKKIGKGCEELMEIQEFLEDFVNNDITRKTYDTIKFHREQGYEFGLEVGQEKEKIDTVKNMLLKNYKISEISDITKMPRSKINEIRKVLIQTNEIHL